MTSNGEQLIVGDMVRLLIAPASLLHDLPSEDQIAIRAAVGGTYRIEGFNIVGMAELEFTSADGVYHTIWIECEHLEKCTAC